MTSFTNTTTNYPEGANTPIKRVKRAGAPTAGTVKNFILGDEWLDTLLGEWWKLTNNPAGGVSWVRIGASGGTTPIDSIQIDTSSGSGTNPLLPTTAGLITMTGAQVATGTVGANVIRTDSTSANSLTLEIQRSTAVAATDSTKNGVSHFNNSHFAVDSSGFVSLSGGGQAIDTLTGDSGGAVGPNGSGNLNIVGVAGQLSVAGNAGTNTLTITPSTVTLTAGTYANITGSPVSLGGTATIAPMSIAKWIVNPTVGAGTHTTITSAIASASSGDNIFITPGTYTENLTLKAGVNLIAFEGDEENPHVTIVGKASFTTAGSVSITSIRFQTNSDFCLAVTGSAASILNLNSCHINCTNNTGISYTSSSSSSAINIYDSLSDLTTTGIALYSMTSAGNLLFDNCNLLNSGSSTTASNASAGVVTLYTCIMTIPISTTGTGIVISEYCGVGLGNTTAYALAGTGNNTIEFNYMNTGNQPCITIGAGGTIFVANSRLTSSAANAITGAGSLSQSNVIYGTTSTTSVTTQTFTPNGLSGTWTPNVQINGSSVGITYTTQKGGYSVIGNTVTIWCDIVLSNKGASVGAVTISNLPFSTSTNGASQALPINKVDNMAVATYTMVYLQLGASSVVGNIAVSSAGTSLASGNLTDAGINNNSAFRFNGTYILD